MNPDEPSTDSDTTDKNQSPKAWRIATCSLGECLLCTTPPNSPASAPPDAEEWFNAQAQSLLQWAKDTGRFLSDTQWGDRIVGFKRIHSGLEHEVFFGKRSGRVFKITKPPYFGHKWHLQDYLQNLIWSNELFEDDVRIEGVIETLDGVSLVTSQDYIHGRKPSEKEIHDWFTCLEATLVRANSWKLPNGIIISDAHTGNLVLTNDGLMIPIDLHVDMPFPLPELPGFYIRLLPIRKPEKDQ